MRPAGSLGGRLLPLRMVAHCLLVERADGLVLVDTGIGTDDLADPARLGLPLRMGIRPDLRPAETARAQVEKLGYVVDDVRDIVLTHMDVDHAGGLADFPKARVHVDATEHLAAEKPHTLHDRQRYKTAQWAHHPEWELHGSGGDDWFGFEGVAALADEVVLIPLRGHTRGHSGVAVRRPEGGWLLHAGDAYFYNGELSTPPSYRKGLVAFQKLMAVDDKARIANQRRLRELHVAHPEVTVFSAHDAAEFDRLTGRAG
jgi:glyoxylase-like metal-dependent hydrolase (beta-lactamase superfamily II)